MEQDLQTTDTSIVDYVNSSFVNRATDWIDFLNLV